MKTYDQKKSQELFDRAKKVMPGSLFCPEGGVYGHYSVSATAPPTLSAKAAWVAGTSGAFVPVGVMVGMGVRVEVPVGCAARVSDTAPATSRARAVAVPSRSGSGVDVAVSVGVLVADAVGGG